MQCKFLLLNIPVEKINFLDEIEFWGHCSNLQVWAENNYDTRLLHRNLSSPLLKQLSDLGDSILNRKTGTVRLKIDGHSMISYIILKSLMNTLQGHSLPSKNLNAFNSCS